VRSERNALVSSHNPWVVKLHYSFQVRTRVGGRGGGDGRANVHAPGSPPLPPCGFCTWGMRSVPVPRD
jgi:hypothetical protein